MPRNAAPPWQFIPANRFSPRGSTRPARRHLHRRFSPHRPNPFPQKSLSFHPQHCPPRQTRVSPVAFLKICLARPGGGRRGLVPRLPGLPEIKGPPPRPSPAAKIPIPQRRFSHIHVNIVGPLQQSNGFTHLFTIIDRTSCWMEAVPLVQTTAAACAKVLISHWVSRFGVLQTLTSDRGPQFTSNVWFELCRMLNIQPVSYTHLTLPTNREV